MLWGMKTAMVMLLALFALNCGEALNDFEPVPECIYPAATWTYSGDRIVCGEGAMASDDGIACSWECAAFGGVCGTRVMVHVADGVSSPVIAYDVAGNLSQCHEYPGEVDDSQPQGAAPLAD